MKHLIKAISIIAISSSLLLALEVPKDHIASTKWLHTHLDDAHLVIVDTRANKAYLKGHIPGAVNIPKKMYFQGTLGSVKKLPTTPEQLQKMYQAVGIDDESAIVFYSGGKNAVDFADAASGVWNSWIYGLHNVALLNGGYAKWVDEKKKTSTTLPTPKVSELELETYDIQEVASIYDIFAAIYDEDKQIADARVSKFYRGEDTKKALARHGRIPTAKLTPMIRYVKKEKDYFIFLDKKEAKSILYNNGFGVELDKPIYFYCNSGHKTRGIWFVAKFIIGVKEAKVYDGGMIEYSRSNMPIAKGEPMD